MRLALLLAIASALFSAKASAQTNEPPGSPVPGSGYVNTLRNGIGAPSNLLGNPGDFYIDTAASILYGPKAGTWPTPGVSLIGPAGNGSGGGNVSGPGSSAAGFIPLWSGTSGMLLATGIAAPSGAILGTTDTQQVTNKSIAASEINSGTLSGARMPAYTGDASSAAGTSNLTLATVNSGSGLCGDATHLCKITTNGKGLVTAQTAIALSAGAWGSLTGTLSAQADLQAALNAKQPTGNYVTALSGDLTAAGPGSATATLKTVNATTGSCGDATHSCQVTTNGKGLVTAQASISISAGGVGTVTHTAGGLTSGQIIRGNGSNDIETGDLSGDISTSGTLATTLAAVNGGSGACGDSTHVCAITTDAKGRVTAQSSAAISTTGAGTVTHSAGALLLNELVFGNGGADAKVGNLTGDVATSGSAATTLATVNGAPGACGDSTHVCAVTTDGKGRITSQTVTAISLAGGAVTHTAGALTSGQLIAGNGSGDIATGNLSGDVTTSGTLSTTLAAVNGGSGSCGDSTHVCVVTTDAKGRVTTQSTAAIAATGSGTVTHTGGALTNNQLMAGAGASDAKVADLSGDVTTSGALATTLATVNSGSGICGDSTHVCQVTTNAKGLVTTQSAVAVSGGGGGAIVATQLLDFAPEISAGTVTFGGSCSSGTPCVYYSSGARYAFTTTAIVAPLTGSAADTLLFYGDASGNLNAAYNSANTYTFTRVTGVAATSAFPPGVFPLYECTITAGAVASCTDDRPLFASTSFANGMGTTITQTAGTLAVNRSEIVDTIATADYTVSGTACGHAELATAGSGTWMMPTPGVGGLMLNGCVVEIRNGGSGVVTLTPTSATIAGLSALAVPLGTSIRVISDGANYQIAAMTSDLLGTANTFTGLNAFSQPPRVPQSTPASSSATCTAGQMWVSSTGSTQYIYVCVSTNSIRRAALSSF